MEFNNKKILLAIVIAAFFVRLLGSNLIVYTDEAHYTNIDAYFSSKYFLTYGAKPMTEELSHPYFSSLGFFPAIPHHPPLSMSLFFISNLFFDGAFAFRIIPIIFGTLSIILIYLVAELQYGKKAGIIAAILGAFGFYHILASVQLDQHGSIHFFFFLISIYSILRWEKEKGKEWFVISAVSAGIAAMNVYSAIFLFAAIGLYMLVMKKDITKSIILMIRFYLISLIIYSIFPILSLIFNKDILMRTFLVAGLFQPTINFRYPVFVLIWLGPLLLGLTLLSLKNFSKKDVIFWLWILVGALPLIFTDLNTSIDRYLMLTIPAFIILSAKFLSEVEVKKKQHIIGITSFLVFYSFLMFLNLNNVDYAPHILENYISNALSLKWNFFFPITGPSGPSFGLVFSSIAFSLIFSFVFWLLTLISLLRNTGIYKAFLSIFLGIAFAFNIVLAQELLLSIAHPNYSEVNYELIDYCKSHDFPEKIYTNNRALFYYLNKTGETLYSYTETSPEETKALLAQGNVTAIIFEFPKIPRESQLWKSLESCKLEKTSYSKGMEYGYMYVC